MNRLTRFSVLLLGSVILISCGNSESVPTVVPTAVPVVQEVQEIPATETAIPATEIPATATEPATATVLPTETNEPEPTETASPTTEISPTATNSPAAATPSVTPNTQESPPPTDIPPATDEPAATSPPPPPSNALVQPPYAASACSDKYPCNDDVAAWEARIRVPAGFQDVYYARINGNPTSLAFGPDGLLYVSTVQGTIYTVNNAGEATAYVGGFIAPTGIAFRPGTSDLYVASRVRNQVIDGEAQVSIVQGGAVRQIVGGLPCCYADMHSANGIAFGPSGLGYVGVGGRADHGEILDGSNRQDELHPFEASILRFSPDGTLVEQFAAGFRNPYDIAWDGNGQLYATDNAPDYGPPEELHRVVAGGQHGYPWFDCEVCFKAPDSVQIIQPIYNFVPHASPTGITSYLSNQFPGYYNSLFVTLWSAFPGAQKVVRFGPGGVGASNFAMGFAQPIDITVGPNGSLYVADFATGIIFQINYTG